MVGDDNYQQDYGDSGEQQPEPPEQQPGQPEQQQQPPPPQQQPSEQEEYGQPPPREKKSKKPMIIGIIVAILIIGAIASYFLFFTGSDGIVGEWEHEEEVYTVTVTYTLKFNEDGTGTFTHEAMGSTTDEFEWEKTGDNELEITDENGDTTTIEYEIKDGGDTLVLKSTPFTSDSGDMEFKRTG